MTGSASGHDESIMWCDWLDEGDKMSSSCLLPVSSLTECIQTISIVPGPLSCGKLLIMSFAPAKSEGMQIRVSRSLHSIMVFHSLKSVTRSPKEPDFPVIFIWLLSARSVNASTQYPSPSRLYSSVSGMVRVQRNYTKKWLGSGFSLNKW